jgi:hypothetical protein
MIARISGLHLHWGEGDLGNAVLVGEAKDAARLVKGDALANGHHVLVEVATHVVEVVEDERALNPSTHTFHINKR